MYNNYLLIGSYDELLSKQGHTTHKRLEFLKLISRIDNQIKMKPRLQLGVRKKFWTDELFTCSIGVQI